MEENDLKMIGQDVAFLKKVVLEMREAMRNSDIFLDEEDKIAVASYVKEKAEGKLFSDDDVKKELGL